MFLSGRERGYIANKWVKGNIFGEMSAITFQFTDLLFLFDAMLWSNKAQAWRKKRISELQRLPFL